MIGECTNWKSVPHEYPANDDLVVLEHPFVDLNVWNSRFIVHYENDLPANTVDLLVVLRQDLSTNYYYLVRLLRDPIKHLVRGEGYQLVFELT